VNAPKTSDDASLMTVAEAARELAMSETYVREQLVYTSRVRSVRFGARRVRLVREDVQRVKREGVPA